MVCLFMAPLLSVMQKWPRWHWRLMGAAIIGLQFGVDRFFTVPAAVGLAVIVGGGGAVFAVTAYIVGAVPAGLLRQSNDRNT